MSDFALFRHKSTGVVDWLPVHYENHPVFGFDLERVDDEHETDKVVLDDHELPVEQRIVRVSKPSLDAENKETEKDDK